MLVRRFVFVRSAAKTSISFCSHIYLLLIQLVIGPQNEGRRVGNPVFKPTDGRMNGNG